MMRQNLTTHDLSWNGKNETSLRAAGVDGTKSKVSLGGQARTEGGLGKVAHGTAQIAKHFIPALMIALMLLVSPPPTQARISIGVSVGIAPPPLLVYEQPPCPGPNFIWTPGYWAWGPDGYFWVPGTWVLAPYPGELWTPGYWSWDMDGDDFVWNEGYWGPEVGFYGGINYGFGYFGVGYEGGYWQHNRFYYDREVNNLRNSNVATVYDGRVIDRRTDYVSYNGGRGGISARPTARELAAARERHDPPAPLQRTQLQAARWNRAQLASANGGRPAVAATQRPGVFSGPRVVRASRFGGHVNLARNRAAESSVPVRNAPQTRRAMRPMLNGRPKAAEPARPSGRAAEPQMRIPHAQRQSNPSHAAVQRREYNPRRAPRQVRAPKPIPHSNHGRNATAMRSHAEKPQQTAQRVRRPTRAMASHAPRAIAQRHVRTQHAPPPSVAQQHYMPERRMPPQRVTPQRSAPQRSAAQHVRPHPPHRGHGG
jgi:WXXGXW repeat (2 copies)